MGVLLFSFFSAKNMPIECSLRKIHYLCTQYVRMIMKKNLFDYQIHDFEGSEANFKKCRALYVALDDKFEVARTNANLANLYMEWGRLAESRKLYREAIAAFEDLERYDFLLLVYKNYGILFEKDLVKYDSAYGQFGRSGECQGGFVGGDG